MDRVQLLSHKGKSVLLLDLNNALPEDTLAAIPKAKALIAKFPPKTGLVITSVKGAKYNKEVAEAIKSFVSHNTPYVKGSAVVGADGAANVLLQTVIFLTRRELKSFPTREEALVWITSLA